MTISPAAKAAIVRVAQSGGTVSTTGMTSTQKQQVDATVNSNR